MTRMNKVTWTETDGSVQLFAVKAFDHTHLHTHTIRLPAVQVNIKTLGEEKKKAKLNILCEVQNTRLHRQAYKELHLYLMLPYLVIWDEKHKECMFSFLVDRTWRPEAERRVISSVSHMTSERSSDEARGAFESFLDEFKRQLAGFDCTEGVVEKNMGPKPEPGGSPFTAGIYLFILAF